jgi:hypothetical protein
MTDQSVNLSTAIYLGVFSRAEQGVLQAIFKAIREGRLRLLGRLRCAWLTCWCSRRNGDLCRAARRLGASAHARQG